MPQVTTPPGRAPEPHDGMVRRGQRQPGAVIMSAGPGAPDRLGLDPGQGTRRGRGQRSVPGTGELHAGLDDVF